VNKGPLCFQYERPTKEEHEALQALRRGEANGYQQQLVLKLITGKFARAHDVLFVPGDSESTGFLAGRGYVGQLTLKYLHVPIGALYDEDNN
jgi:hypothetical protein